MEGTDIQRGVSERIFTYPNSTGILHYCLAFSYDYRIPIPTEIWFNGDIILTIVQGIWLPRPIIFDRGETYYFSHYSAFADDRIYYYTTDEEDPTIQRSEAT